MANPNLRTVLTLNELPTKALPDATPHQAALPQVELSHTAIVRVMEETPVAEHPAAESTGGHGEVEDGPVIEADLLDLNIVEGAEPTVVAKVVGDHMIVLHFDRVPEGMMLSYENGHVPVTVGLHKGAEDIVIGDAEEVTVVYHGQAITLPVSELIGSPKKVVHVNEHARHHLLHSIAEFLEELEHAEHAKKHGHADHTEHAIHLHSHTDHPHEDHPKHEHKHEHEHEHEHEEHFNLEEAETELAVRERFLEAVKDPAARQRWEERTGWREADFRQFAQETNQLRVNIEKHKKDHPHGQHPHAPEGKESAHPALPGNGHPAPQRLPIAPAPRKVEKEADGQEAEMPEDMMLDDMFIGGVDVQEAQGAAQRGVNNRALLITGGIIVSAGLLLAQPPDAETDDERRRKQNMAVA
jgi:hypothetical protein